jgi:hypothetical protein
MNKKTHHLPHIINLDKKWWLVLIHRITTYLVLKWDGSESEWREWLVGNRDVCVADSYIWSCHVVTK